VHAGAVVGVDGYRKGWVAVALRDGRVERVVACPNFTEVLDTFPDAGAIGIDIPIGLPVEGFRNCDQAARRLLGPLWSSVFLTAPRAVLEEPTYPEALERSRALIGAGISRQAYGLRARILEVDSETVAGDRVFEVHPEVCFRALAGRPLTTRKTTWAGMWSRLDLLRRAGIDLPADLGTAGVIPPADVIDAAAAAWTAARIATHQAECVAPPEKDARGRLVTIWY
jgi:predicted RNase H-like nuclease